MKCCFCNEDAGKFGNNAQPIKEGFCCNSCNLQLVIPKRLELFDQNMERYYDGH